MLLREATFGPAQCALLRLGLTYAAGTFLFWLTQGWIALCASALMFAHPFTLWDAPCIGCRWRRRLASFATLAANTFLALRLGAQGVGAATSLQGFVWAVLAVCLLPIALDLLARKRAGHPHASA